MSYEFGVKAPLDADEWFDGPEILVLARGSHDCSRLVQALRHGNSEQYALGEQIARSLNRYPLGQRVTQLLRLHGGEDLTSLHPGLFLHPDATRKLISHLLAGNKLTQTEVNELLPNESIVPRQEATD